jgi:hypothetical protein
MHKLVVFGIRVFQISLKRESEGKPIILGRGTFVKEINIRQIKSWIGFIQ